MIIYCCSKALLEFEIKELIENNLSNDELLEFKIIPNPIKKGTFDLSVKQFKEISQTSGEAN